MMFHIIIIVIIKIIVSILGSRKCPPFKHIVYVKGLVTLGDLPEESPHSLGVAAVMSWVYRSGFCGFSLGLSENPLQMIFEWEIHGVCFRNLVSAAVNAKIMYT